MSQHRTPAVSAKQTLDKIAAMLGSAREWDSAADYLEDIAYTINESGVYPARVSDQDEQELGYWREVATQYGIGWDDDDDFDPDALPYSPFH